MFLRRVLGYAFIVFGILNILDFASPRPIPTVGPSAFIVGGFFIALGIFIKGKKEGTSSIGWDRAKTLFSASINHKKNDSASKTNGDPLLPVRVLRLAADKQGKLTVAQTAMELNVTLDAAEEALDECAKKGGASIDIDPSTGIASYRFPEFAPGARKS